MSNHQFASVWDAIEDTPEEAENMKLRSILMMALKNHITRTGMSQAHAAKLFGVTQPRVSDMMRGRAPGGRARRRRGRLARRSPRPRRR